MSLHQIRRGFDIRLAGAPQTGPASPWIPAEVALVGADYPGMRPTLRVEPGDAVDRGAVLFEDKKTPGVRFVSPVGGRVRAIHRGERRAFRSLVIEVSPGERGGRPGASRNLRVSGSHPEATSEDSLKETLLESGEWTAIRSRPFGRVANPERRPQAILVTAMDTAPHAPDPVAAVEGRDGDLQWGVGALTRLTDGPVFLCAAPGRRLPVPGSERVRHEEFAGPHPAGAAGLHIHRLVRAGRGREAWHLDAQDLAALGRLLRTGETDPLRTIALGGPPVARPRQLRTVLGAGVEGIESATGGIRFISGSVLSGRTASGDEAYLGRYHRQVTVLEEDRRRRFLGWLAPGFFATSASRAFASSFLPSRDRQLTTSAHGSRRAIVPIEVYERVMAFDIPPVFLLRALLMEDLERAEELGVLELVEEDLALLSFVCPGKNDYAPALRRVLDALEKEG